MCNVYQGGQCLHQPHFSERIRMRILFLLSALSFALATPFFGSGSGSDPDYSGYASGPDYSYGSGVDYDHGSGFGNYDYSGCGSDYSSDYGPNYGSDYGSGYGDYGYDSGPDFGSEHWNALP